MAGERQLNHRCLAKQEQTRKGQGNGMAPPESNRTKLTAMHGAADRDPLKGTEWCFLCFADGVVPFRVQGSRGRGSASSGMR